MALLKKILGKLDGLHYPQDYLCLAKESFEQPLCVYLISDNHVLPDFSGHHVFAGYSPVIFALDYLPGSNLPPPANIELAFCTKPLQPNEIFSGKEAIAILFLKKIKEQFIGSDRIVYYQAEKGKHRFLAAFPQFIRRVSNRLYNKKPGNVFLPGNQYQQVEIAYSIPRNISLITVGGNNLYNLFPTDLHGQVGKEHYLISLRQNGKACRQTENAKHILLSKMNAAAYKMVYGLGKNHMQELKPKEQFPLSCLDSAVYNLPLPESTLEYKELELQESFTHGIHKLLLFKIVHESHLTDNPATLSHIHNSYATWRYNNSLGGNYLLR